MNLGTPPALQYSSGPFRTQWSERKTPVHGAACWGRMGPHRAGRTGPASARDRTGAWAWGLACMAKNNPGKGGNKRRAAGCYLLRWRWTNNPLALTSKYPIPADLFIADPTCLIARWSTAWEETRGPRPSLWRAKEECIVAREFVGMHSKHPFITKCVHGTGRSNFGAGLPISSGVP
jgi:hypothetical protein